MGMSYGAIARRDAGRRAGLIAVIAVVDVALLIAGAMLLFGASRPAPERGEQLAIEPSPAIDGSIGAPEREQGEPGPAGRPDERGGAELGAPIDDPDERGGPPTEADADRPGGEALAPPVGPADREPSEPPGPPTGREPAEPRGGVDAGPVGETETTLAVDARAEEPAPAATASADDIAVHLAKLVVQSGGRLTRCYEQAAKAFSVDKPLSGEVDIGLAVLPSGAGSNVRVLRNTTGSADLARCVLATAQGWTYPAHTETEAIEFVRPFRFGPQ